MAITQARIAIESAKVEGLSNQQLKPTPMVMRVTRAIPPAPYYDNITNAYVFSQPKYAGELICYNVDDKYANLYVALSESNALSWHRVDMSAIVIDTRTGRPYDPNATFYTNLAS